MLAAREVVAPVFFVDEVVGVFLTLDQALRSVDPADLPGAPAYDAEGRRLVLRAEGRHTVLDEGASGEACPDELRAHLVAFAADDGVGVRDPSTIPLAELVDAYARNSTLPARPSPAVYLVLVAVLVLGIVVMFFVV